MCFHDQSASYLKRGKTENARAGNFDISAHDHGSDDDMDAARGGNAATVYPAPRRRASGSSRPSIFLAGTTRQTSSGDWRARLTAALSAHPIDVFNPARADWDATWREDFTDARWAQQVEWELDAQDEADLVVVYLAAATDAPVSLLELGLAVARTGKTVVVCAEDGYRKRGNVEAVCARFGHVLVATEGALVMAVKAVVEDMLAEGAPVKDAGS
ncbi:nucleoside 2-deoxyribosyltransferase domain-containing protein [Purpureocillium lavendulum]|uniref:Nucleoside 2-deoxyribosyltransferase domain-containing protein n=1 Tax=Purpureocillium lavendulum TaxID=1247861 RepID=A0AB34FJJ7_9HYPO|nr:nucleoside 2-deoxyribosyltransferase domain-containing protein [Purpureocillium lavendulum]